VLFFCEKDALHNFPVSQPISRIVLFRIRPYQKSAKIGVGCGLSPRSRKTLHYQTGLVETGLAKNHYLKEFSDFLNFWIFGNRILKPVSTSEFKNRPFESRPSDSGSGAESQFQDFLIIFFCVHAQGFEPQTFCDRPLIHHGNLSVIYKFNAIPVNNETKKLVYRSA